MNILVVDDEEILQDVLGLLLRKEGYRPIAARTGEEALLLFDKEPIDLVLLDVMLPGMSGMDVLRQIRQRDPEQVVVVITAYSSIEGAIEAMRQGAFHYVPKPFKNEEVLLTIRKGLEQRRLTQENRELREQLGRRYGLDNIIGKSQPMQQVFDLIRLSAPSKSNILILGESGTGKELVAKAIHHHSRRSDGPFVTVNSGSMPPDLLESTLFGHVKGAFTGAIAAKKGLFELADGGSIFFDEIGNMAASTQAKVLRVLQEREFERLGGSRTVKIDVRLVAATNRDLATRVARGQFREDLYYRLNVFPIALPPLRERREDIPLLVWTFAKQYGAALGKPVERIPQETMEALQAYPWPGNIRELKNVIERAVILSEGSTLRVPVTPPAGAPAPLAPTLADAERTQILAALEQAGWRIRGPAGAAALLGLKPTTLESRIKKLGLQRPR